MGSKYPVLYIRVGRSTFPLAPVVLTTEDLAKAKAVPHGGGTRYSWEPLAGSRVVLYAWLPDKG